MPQIKHCVLFKFKATTSTAVIEEIFADLEQMRQTIPGLLDLSWGPNISVENLSQGFTHGFVLTFADDAARHRYLPHPLHQALVAKIVPELDGGLSGALVVDW